MKKDDFEETSLYPILLFDVFLWYCFGCCHREIETAEQLMQTFCEGMLVLKQAPTVLLDLDQSGVEVEEVRLDLSNEESCTSVIIKYFGGIRGPLSHQSGYYSSFWKENQNVEIFSQLP